MWLGAGSLALGQICWGQRAANWRVYKAADGLAESSCTSLSLSPQGRVLVRHLGAAAVSELDGYSVHTFPCSQPGNARVHSASSGQLWTLAPQGLLQFKEDSWLLRPVPEIAAEFRAGRLHVVETIVSGHLLPVRRSVVLVLLSDRLVEVSFESSDRPRLEVLRAVGQGKLQKFSSLAPARDGGLWIAGTRGLAKASGPIRGLNPKTEWQEYLLPETLEVQNLQEPHDNADGTITAVADSTKDQQRVIASLLDSGAGVSPALRFQGETPLEAGGTPAPLHDPQWAVERVGAERIRHAWHGPDGSRWACTSRSLFQWEAGSAQIIENEELAARQYYDVAIEPGGGFWLATSDGLFRYAPSTWHGPVAGKGQTINSPIRCLASDAEGGLWFVSGSGLHQLRNERQRDFPFTPDSPLRNLDVRSLAWLKSGKLLLIGEPSQEKEEGGDQLFEFQPEKGFFRPVQAGLGAGPVKVLGRLGEGSVSLQLNPGASEGERSLVRWDGLRLEPLAEAPPARLVGRALNVMFAAQNGDWWLSAERGVAWYHDKQWRAFAATDNGAPGVVLFFTELPDGKLWCATHDQVWEFDGKNWLTIRRGFDQINGLSRTRDGSVWVASNSGLHRYFQGAWVENGLEEGLPSASVRHVYEDPRGQLWAGTTRGLSVHHPESDPDKPQVSIQNFTGDTVPEGGTITFTFSGQDKWKYTTPGRLLYSYRLDEREWTVFREANGVSFTDLPAGKHYFQARAMDRNCNVGDKPDRLEFSVVLPWYHEVRLVLITLAGLAGVLFFAVLAFNRHRRLVRSYAEVEQKVTERTAQLEIANRELLHSQKMTALGTLAAGIAHDFNNILSIIQGSAQIIEDNLEDADKVRTRLERIKTVVEQGSGVIKAMLGFSRDSSGEPPGVCDLNAVVEETIKLLGDRFLREVEVTFERAPNLAPVQASKDFIQQILLNFIFNAAESMAKRKQIILSTSALEQLPAALVLSPAAARTYAAISVRDLGDGITAENLPRIFEPFFTTKALSTRRGTGLGLSMAYELAKKMGAGLAVESVVDEGSRFSLILPVAEATAVEDGKAAEAGC